MPVIPAPFEYRSPETLAEAVSLLAKYGGEARVLSGGHGLIPALKLRLLAPAVVIDLRRVPDLRSVAMLGGGLRVGALATHREVESSPLVRARAPLLAETARAIGDVQVRNWGTIGGAIAGGDPGADYPAALLALDGEVVIAGPRGERRVLAAEFCRGRAPAALEPGEIIRAVDLPAGPAAGAAYLKMRRSACGFAIAGVAVRIRVAGRQVESASAGVTGVAAGAFRAVALEEALRGREIDPELVAEACRGIAAGREVLADLHASAEYRAAVAEVLARRAVLLAAARARDLAGR
jgi:carbon-monoxide dehydrogenase medium subunit